MLFHFIGTQTEELWIALSEYWGGQFFFNVFLKIRRISRDAVEEAGEVQGWKVFILREEDDPRLVALTPNAYGDLQFVRCKNDLAVIGSL